MIRVLVVDDHPVVREGLVAVLGDQPDVEVAGSAATAEAAIDLAARVRPDVVLLDLELPGLDGVAAIPRLLATGQAQRPSSSDSGRNAGTAQATDGDHIAGPGRVAVTGESGQTRVIVFTAYDTDERVFGALEAGASGYLLKGAPVEEIVRAIREVRAGGSHLAPRVAAKVIGAVGRSRRPAEGALTEREREVLRLVADGLQNKQIGRMLGISERTVKYHLTAILTRLGADNRAQAVAIATGRGLLTGRGRE